MFIWGYGKESSSVASLYEPISAEVESRGLEMKNVPAEVYGNIGSFGLHEVRIRATHDRASWVSPLRSWYSEKPLPVSDPQTVKLIVDLLEEGIDRLVLKTLEEL